MSGLFERLGSAFLAPPAPARGEELTHGVPPSTASDRRRKRRKSPRRTEPSTPSDRRQHREALAPPAAPSGSDESRRSGVGSLAIPRRSGVGSLAILCRAADALVVGAAAALVLAGRSRRSHALVAVWKPGEEPPAVARAPATAAARRLAASLDSRGHEATASGRLALVRLAGDAAAAAAEAIRANAAAGDVPTVVVLAGAREDRMDGLLRDQDAVLVALPEPADGAVADLALAGLADLGVPAEILAIPATSAPIRALAGSGLAALPPLRAPIDAALASLDAGGTARETGAA